MMYKVAGIAFLSGVALLIGGCRCGEGLPPEESEPQARDFTNYGDKVVMVDIYAHPLIEKSELISGGGYLPIFTPETNGVPGGLSMTQVSIAPGGGIATHKSDKAETVYVVSGSGELKLNDRILVINHGNAVYVPPNIVQSVVNNSSVKLQLLLISEPQFSDENLQIIAPPPKLEEAAKVEAFSVKSSDASVMKNIQTATPTAKPKEIKQ
ncbi:MAG: cupin domain-containing protein [Victivallaceae bacterium]